MSLYSPDICARVHINHHTDKHHFFDDLMMKLFSTVSTFSSCPPHLTMYFTVFHLLLLLMMFCISFDVIHDRNANNGCESCESDRLQLLSSSSMSFFVDSAFKNQNDTIAMLAFRQSFNNFTNSNWTSSNDPCAVPSMTE
jgi:hypothetical protein